MAFNYETNVNALVQTLKDYNTTTAAVDLSNGLTTRIESDNIKQHDIEVAGVLGWNLPAVYVRIVNADEEFVGLGITGPSGNKKEKTVKYQIIGIYKREGLESDHADLMTETYRLAKNIEGVLQAELDLSGTALWCNPGRTEFSAALEIDTGAWVKAVVVDVEAKYFFR